MPGEDGIAVGVDRDLGVVRVPAGGGEVLDRARNTPVEERARAWIRMSSAALPGEDGVAVGVDRDVGLD